MKKRILVPIALVLFAVAFAFATPTQANAKVGKVKKLSVVSKAKGKTKKANITVKWSKVKGAKKYLVYRATKKSGKYKKVKTVNKTSYIDKKKKGLFYYKVRAVSGSSKGKFSAKKGTYTVSGKLMFYTTTTLFYGQSFRATWTNIYNLGKKSLFVHDKDGYNNVVVMKDGKKTISDIWSASIISDNKVEKIKDDVGLRSGLYYGETKDIYLQYTMTNSKKTSPSFMVWVNMHSGETYVEEGKDCKKSSIFKYSKKK